MGVQVPSTLQHDHQHLKQLPCEEALAIGKRATAKLDFNLRLSHERTGLQPTYEWISVQLQWWRRTHELLANLVRVRESLELLTAIAACDGYGLQENPGFWVQIWSGQRVQDVSQLVLPASNHKTPQFVVNADLWSANKLALIEQLVLPNPCTTATRSNEFQRAMRTLRAYMPPTYRLEIRCGFQISLPCAGWQTNQENFCGLSALINASAPRNLNKETSITSQFAPLVIDVLFLSLVECNTPDCSGPRLDSLVGLFDKTVNVHIANLRVDFGIYQQSPSKHQLSHFASLMRIITRRPDKYQENNNLQQIIRRLDLERIDQSPSFYGELCSALPKFQSVDNLCLQARPGTALKWNWLALALFHPAASTSNIHRLDVTNFVLSMADVAAIREQLARPWHSSMKALISQWSGERVILPTTEFSDRNAHMNDMVWRVSLRKHTKVRAKPTRFSFTYPLVTLDEDETFDVLDISPSWRTEWICILLPGYGYGFVEQNDVVRMEVAPVKPSSCHTKITSLAMSSYHHEATVAFLELIGASLKTVKITFETALTPKYIQEILHCCPKLTTLEIQAQNVVDLADIFDMCTISTSTSISSLQLNVCGISNSFAHHLAKRLADRSFAECSQLRELSFGSSSLLDEVLDDLIAMVKVNRTLRSFHVPLTSSQLEYYKPRFLAYRSDHVHTESMSSKAKYAFLEGIGYYSTSTSILRNVERGIIQSIFEFAGDKECIVSVEVV